MIDRAALVTNDDPAFIGSTDICLAPPGLCATSRFIQVNRNRHLSGSHDPLAKFT